MRFSVLFSDAFGAIKRNKKRSILTMLGIIIGIGAVIAIISIGQGFENYVVDSLTSEDSNELSTTITFQANDSNLYNDENIEFFNSNDIRNIEKLSGVSKVEEMQGSIMGDDVKLELETRNNKKNAMVKIQNSTKQSISDGRNLTSVDNAKESRVVIISESLAETLYPDTKNYINKSVDIKGLSYNIVGIYENTVEMFGATYDVYMPKKTYEFYNKEKVNASTITVYLNKGANVKDVSENVVEYLEEKGSMKSLGSYMYVDLGEIMDGISSVLDSITLFIALIGGISLFIAGIGMMNMMFISVSERTKEIGIRRALGATKRNITMQFLLEGIIITILGGILGYFFGLIFAMVISIFLPFSVAIHAGPVMTALIISLAIGIIFSYSPAKAAANKNVIEILA
ncbi:ABC transporter permease [Miniphocaeibacter massiliensis]|uniref:ABC transporter permease n=1 Tax=Miniphocaeibacter massiliensis TaxID=2041841 RepID=UPI000C07245C|nr:ABC transporter permease [Miniphocaeibacter massiliensis]